MHEWQDFYRITAPLLMKTKLPTEYADQGKREALIHTFFTDKIFLNAATSKAGQLENVYALHTFLKRFAQDIQKGNVLEPELGPEEPHAAAAMSYEQVLAEAGIDFHRVDDAAGEFVNKLDDGESAYLRYSTCAESEDKEPISRIAKRLKLGTAFHHRAKRLGITREKGATYHGYEETKIGRWLLSVGAKLNPEWREELAILLTLLCQKVYQQGRDAA